MPWVYLRVDQHWKHIYNLLRVTINNRNTDDGEPLVKQDTQNKIKTQKNVNVGYWHVEQETRLIKYFLKDQERKQNYSRFKTTLQAMMSD